jgi:polyketide synthase PksJ
MLRLYMRERVPAYMVPTHFVPLETMPLTANGKLDRKALAGRRDRAPREVSSHEKLSAVEEAIATLWRRVLDVVDVDGDIGFFDAGGDSILAVMLARRVADQFHISFGVTDLFRNNTVESMAQYVDSVIGAKASEVELPQHDASHSPEQDGATPGASTIAAEYPDYYRRSLAVIGISCQFPGASDHREFWQNLRSAKESIELLAVETDAAGRGHRPPHPARFVGARAIIRDKDIFDAEFFKITPRDAEVMDPQLRLLLLHAWRAVEDAGYVPREIPDTSVFMSTSVSGYQQARAQVTDTVADSYMNWISAQSGTVPTMISHKLGLKGPSYSVHSNCSSSLVGLYAAQQSILAGESRYSIVGAATVSPFMTLGYAYQEGLNFSVDGHVRTFDATASGMIGGEGVAVLVLKRADQAVADRDHIYAVLRGVTVNNDGGEKAGYYAPSVQGQARVIHSAFRSIGVSPESIGYIEAHGTATRLGDPIEVASLTEVYRTYTSKRQYCGIGSVKTNIGHCDTAAGLAGCIKVVLSLYNAEIPPSLNYQTANPALNLHQSPFYIVDQLKSWDDAPAPHRAAVSSFGIGGTNAHAIFESYK